MGKFNGVLIASDFDGTLTDEKGTLLKKNTDAIHYFISEGGKFTISTGRTKIGFHTYKEDIINAPVLLANGGMAFDYKNNKTVFINSIEQSEAVILSRILRDKHPVCMELYGADDNVYVVNVTDESRRHTSGLKISAPEYITNLDNVRFPLVKVMLITGSRSSEIQEYLMNSDLDSMKYIPCRGSFVEILSKKAGKGIALLQLADYLGIKKDDVYAVGDGSNDVDMIKAASLGFVPENGDELARCEADVIVDSNNIGSISHVIEYLDKKY